jgi:hypothetical protein
VQPRTPEEHLLQVLQTQPEPVYALLDAARDLRVFILLKTCQEERQSLYEGVEGEKLALVAPYLVRLPPGSPLLEALVREGWGKSWGVFLTCGESFAEVRKHFRRFLLVKTDKGEELYFRFYDPRVLRAFLPTCQPQQAGEFFGPIGRYLAEDENAQAMLCFTAGAAGVKREATPFQALEPAVTK